MKLKKQFPYIPFKTVLAEGTYGYNFHDFEDFEEWEKSDKVERSRWEYGYHLVKK